MINGIPAVTAPAEIDIITAARAGPRHRADR
jgi:hypothetical protein